MHFYLFQSFLRCYKYYTALSSLRYRPGMRRISYSKAMLHMCTIAELKDASFQSHNIRPPPIICARSDRLVNACLTTLLLTVFT